MLREEPVFFWHPYGYNRDFRKSGDAIKHLKSVCEQKGISLQRQKIVITDTSVSLALQ